MSLKIGQQLASYEITALLGTGGMGEVYRARDSNLKREVAIKVLPDEFSRDADRVGRFQREAEVLASLSHPNIGSIYDLAQAGQTRYLVLELVEGETLAHRIAGGPIPVEEALDIAKHICEALEAAHEKGIIHRDLKPANVKITPDGKVKVLDFGLAKAIENTPAAATLSKSPTMLSLAATNAGMILGTVAYMSPEQAKMPTSGSPDRHFRVWLCALRDADRTAGFRRRRCYRDCGTRCHSGARVEPVAGCSAVVDSAIAPADADERRPPAAW
jgi:serine/threonine-protein kinase